MIVASIKGFGPGPYEDCKVYENVAQCDRRRGLAPPASTTGRRSVTGAQIGDSGTGLHLALRHPRRALPAHSHRHAASGSNRACRTACSTFAASSFATSSA